MLLVGLQPEFLEQAGIVVGHKRSMLKQFVARIDKVHKTVAFCENIFFFFFNTIHALDFA